MREYAAKSDFSPQLHKPDCILVLTRTPVSVFFSLEQLFLQRKLKGPGWLEVKMPRKYMKMPRILAKTCREFSVRYLLMQEASDRIWKILLIQGSQYRVNNVR